MKRGHAGWLPLLLVAAVPLLILAWAMYVATPQPQPVLYRVLAPKVLENESVTEWTDAEGHKQKIETHRKIREKSADE